MLEIIDEVRKVSPVQIVMFAYTDRINSLLHVSFVIRLFYAMHIWFRTWTSIRRRLGWGERRNLEVEFAQSAEQPITPELLFDFARAYARNVPLLC
jgi:hypothetical protein